MTGVTNFASAGQGLAAAVLNAISDPADALRLLASLATPAAVLPTPAGAVGTAMATMQSGVGDLFRRAAVAALARASAKYQPNSFDDAVSVRATVCAFLDAEILIAGNQGEDATYTALRALRAAVVNDLTTRGAVLATLNTVHTSAPIPAPVLALRLYRDPSRADELVTEAGPIHPAFMPTSFKALSQ